MAKRLTMKAWLNVAAGLKVAAGAAVAEATKEAFANSQRQQGQREKSQQGQMHGTLTEREGSVLLTSSLR